ncbi:uncharacterized protein LOC127288412 [Leptopilina boulardi]|uniref:uncharacterized protein LOC127288412 n=1 Tax=Leptopilina boulardi TaxID=63433 RepID=UPI0021F50A02|nr:uncharacterized protein LOC127288412 [Leptopilina boulardi]
MYIIYAVTVAHAPTIFRTRNTKRTTREIALPHDEQLTPLEGAQHKFAKAAPGCRSGAGQQLQGLLETGAAVIILKESIVHLLLCLQLDFTNCKENKRDDSK